PIKRYDVACAAIEILRTSNPNAMLYPLSGNVDYETMLLLLNACDCLLICSDSEGSPVMVKEAMACNLPVVTTDVGDVVSVIDGSHPSGVAEQRPKAIAEEINLVLQAGIRSNGRQIIQDKNLDSVGITNSVLRKYSMALMKDTHD
ncbi:MAG: glycosyltransferase, partial [Flavobacteriales bacterium]